MLLSTLPSDVEGNEAEIAFQNQCCLALMTPVIFLGLSLVIVFVADQFNLLDFHMLYALALQVIMLFIFTIVYLARGLNR
jgi:hypothetical protein